MHPNPLSKLFGRHQYLEGSVCNKADTALTPEDVQLDMHFVSYDC